MDNTLKVIAIMCYYRASALFTHTAIWDPYHQHYTKQLEMVQYIELFVLFWGDHGEIETVSLIF